MMEGRRPAVLGALAVSLLVLLASLGSLGYRRQLALLGGLTDEWHPLGANLAVYGVLGLEHEPWVLRPPGYPAFVAALLLAANPPAAASLEWVTRTRPLVFAGNALLLAAAAGLLSLWLGLWLQPRLAIAAALVLGTNPLSIAWVGLAHYGLLHVLGLIAAMWALQRALWPPQAARAFALAGAMVGLVTLVRPVTLPMPAFVLAALVLLRVPPGRALARAAVFSLAMAAVIAPWTLRNYRVVRAFVPVNLQAGVVLWAATARPLPWDAEHYVWYELSPQLLGIHARVTGRPDYDFFTFARRLPELEREYRTEALRNLRRQPLVYAHNVARNAWAFLAQANTSLPRAFVRLQHEPPSVEARARWFARAEGEALGADGLGAGIRLLFAALTLLAAAAVVLAVRQRDASLAAPLALLACVGLSHAVTHIDLLHNYLRLPFVVVLAFYGLDRLAHAGRPALASALAGGLAATSLCLSGWMLLS
jgi:hypothetical protein